MSKSFQGYRCRFTVTLVAVLLAAGLSGAFPGGPAISGPVLAQATTGAAPELCPANRAIQSLYFEGFESGDAAPWTPATLSGSSDRGTGPVAGDWYLSPPPVGRLPYSGRGNLWVDPAGAHTDSVVAMKHSHYLPENSHLLFAHRFALDRAGGIVEFSTDGGGHWQDVTPLFGGAGYGRYPGWLATSGGPGGGPGFAAFTGDSDGYRSSRLDLSTLAGQAVRFRFRLIQGDPQPGHPVTAPAGWFIDDLILYTCADPSSPKTEPDTQPTSSRRSGLTLALATRPRIAGRGQNLRLRAVIRNHSEKRLRRLRVCLRAPRRHLGGPRCLRVDRLPPRAAASLNFTMRVGAHAPLGRRLRVRLTVQSGRLTLGALPQRLRVAKARQFASQ